MRTMLAGRISDEWNRTAWMANAGRLSRTGCGLAALLLLSAPSGRAAAADAVSPSSPSNRVVSFARGTWDPAQWSPLRLPQQKTLRAFAQRDDSIGVEAFTADEIKGGMDNILLATDAGTAEGEFEVVFSLSEEQGTAPGVFLAPLIKDGVMERAVAIFVASYTMAVWRAELDPVKGETKYTHLVRVTRWTEPGQKHTLRCRFSTSSKSIAIRLDQGDPIVLRDTGIEMNSKIGVWGCHGRCDFYSVTFAQKPVLEWSASDPHKKTK